MAYEEKDVIKGITFDVKGREKIGIVGRTGAGKSSIINGLFRMTEPRGDMFIDGIRVNDIGLHDLRKVVGIYYYLYLYLYIFFLYYIYIFIYILFYT